LRRQRAIQEPVKWMAAAHPAFIRRVEPAVKSRRPTKKLASGKWFGVVRSQRAMALAPIVRRVNAAGAERRGQRSKQRQPGQQRPGRQIPTPRIDGRCVQRLHSLRHPARGSYRQWVQGIAAWATLYNHSSRVRMKTGTGTASHSDFHRARIQPVAEPVPVFTTKGPKDPSAARGTVRNVGASLFCSLETP